MSTSPASRLAYVDSLRFAAALLVLFQHIGEHFESGIVKWVIGFGPGLSGVILFFLISGFVIPFSVRMPFDPVTYMFRRLFRVYPLLIAALALTALVGWSGLIEQWAFVREATLWQWLANLLLVQDFVGQPPVLGVTWTLAIEMIWYTMFAVALMLVPQRIGPVLIFGMAALMIILAVASLLIEARIPLGRPGMLYATVLGFRFSQWQQGKIAKRELLRDIALFLIITWFTNWVAFGWFQHPHITMEQAVGPWTVAILLFSGTLLSPKILEARFLNTGWFPKVGASSYSIYLLHPFAIAASFQYLEAPLAAVLSVVVTLIAAAFGFRWIETPGIALGRKFTARFEPALASGTASA